MRSRRYRPTIASRTLDAAEIDSVKQHLQVGGADLDAGGFGVGETKRAGFEPLVDDDEAVFIPVQELDAVGAFVAKDGVRPATRVAAVARSDRAHCDAAG